MYIATDSLYGFFILMIMFLLYGYSGVLFIMVFLNPVDMSAHFISFRVYGLIGKRMLFQVAKPVESMTAQKCDL